MWAGKFYFTFHSLLNCWNFFLKCPLIASLKQLQQNSENLKGKDEVDCPLEACLGVI